MDSVPQSSRNQLVNIVDWLPWQPGRTHFHIQADFGLPMEEGECVDRERGHVMEGGVRRGM